MNVTSVGDLLQCVKGVRRAGESHSHVRWWFRGQPDEDHVLCPGVFRPAFATDAATRLKKEQHLTQDFRVMSAGLAGRNVGDAELYLLQQHYGMPTRLLDWTTNAIAALYFAVSKMSDMKKNGKLFALDAYQLRQVQGAPEEYEGIATSRREVFTEMLKPIFGWGGDAVERAARLEAVAAAAQAITHYQRAGERATRRPTVLPARVGRPCSTRRYRRRRRKRQRARPREAAGTPAFRKHAKAIRFGP
jgi:FRG domain